MTRLSIEGINFPWSSRTFSFTADWSRLFDTDIGSPSLIGSSFFLPLSLTVVCNSSLFLDSVNMSKEVYTPPPRQNREAYTPPTAGVDTSQTFTALPAHPPVAISYLCAGLFSPDFSRWQIDCGASNSISPKEQIRCRECGHRVMYKKRTRRMGMQSWGTFNDSSAIWSEMRTLTLRGNGAGVDIWRSFRTWADLVDSFRGVFMLMDRSCIINWWKLRMDLLWKDRSQYIASNEWISPNHKPLPRVPISSYARYPRNISR